MFEWLSTRAPILVYLFLIFNSFFESLFPPYPSDAFVLVFAFVAGQGNYNVYLVYLLTVIGSITGIMVLYYIGKSRGDAIIRLFSHSFLGRIFPVDLIERAKQKFTGRGNMVTLLNRFLPGMRAPICFAAGVVKLDTGKFFLYSLTSVILWNLFLVIVGFYVGSTWYEASQFLKNYNVIITVLLIILLIFYTILFFRKRKKL